MSDDNFGLRLKQARVAANLTQSDLAERIGMHSLSVSRWEVGGSEPTSKVLKIICEALSINADFLLFGTRLSQPPAPEAA